MFNKSREKLVPKTANYSSTTSKMPKPPPMHKQKVQSVIQGSQRQNYIADKRIITAQQTSKLKKSIQKPKHLISRKAERPLTYSKPSMAAKHKQKSPSNNHWGWSQLPLNLLLSVAQYCCIVPFDVYRLSLVCSTWRNLMECENAVYFWKRFSKTSGVSSFDEFKEKLTEGLQQLKKKRGLEFQTLFTKLFNYGSTKQNIPNKLINKLKLEIEVTLNSRHYKNYKFKLRHFNFSSYIYTKVQELALVPFEMYTPHNMFKDPLEITIKFYSKAFKVSHSLHYKFKPEEIVQEAIKQKAFNYFLAKNVIITFFEGDKSFLYLFMEMSVLELIIQFRKVIKNQFQTHIDKKTKKLPMYKKLCETQFEDFVEYIKYQADFQLHMSYHNSITQIFTHCDTKVYPLEYDKKRAYFQVKIDDTFDKTSTFQLDNKMGISQKIDDLYLLDFVLKDRDRFIFVFSGFIYARKAIQKERESIENYLDFSECPIKVLQFHCKKYEFSIMVIEEKKKNLIRSTRFSIYP